MQTSQCSVIEHRLAVAIGSVEKNLQSKVLTQVVVFWELGSGHFQVLSCSLQVPTAILPNLSIYSVSSSFYSAILHVLLHILSRATYR
jgi:hypothetical protein